MKIIFYGTKGYIEESNPQHKMHSACLIEYNGKRLLLDYGENWPANSLIDFAPDWICITHAHPDHSFGLRHGTDLPVFVSQDSYNLLKQYPVSDFRVVEADTEFSAGPFRILAYSVIHSIRAPAIGFKISAGGHTIIYNSDIVAIDRKENILPGTDIYIGDGSTLTRPMVRRRGESLFGHTTVRAQLNWCKQFDIPRAFIIHCGKQLVEMAPDVLQQKVDEQAEGEVQAVVAYDGMEVDFT